MEIVNEGESNQDKNADINDKESNFNELITLIILIYIYIPILLIITNLKILPKNLVQIIIIFKFYNININNRDDKKKLVINSFNDITLPLTKSDEFPQIYDITIYNIDKKIKYTIKNKIINPNKPIIKYNEKIKKIIFI